jgi:ADP-ribose pyrophosphatase
MDDRPQVESSQRVFEGPVFNVRVDRLRYPDGSQHRCDVVEHPGSVAIIAMPSTDSLVLVRQYRHAASTALWELPAGCAKAGEPLETGAGRELREETGLSAERMISIGALFATPGFCTETMNFFVADGLTQGEQMLDEDERIDVKSFSVDAAWRLVAGREIADMKTVLGLLWLGSNRGEIGGHFGR